MSLINVGDLFMDTVYADFIFVVDKKEIPGHRLVLAKSCPYFDKLLFGDFLESKSKKVEISGISANNFKEVIRFIYKGQLEVEEWTIQDLLSLLAVAHEYQFQPLFSAVTKALERQPLDFDSWPLVNSAAYVYDSEELRRKCASFAEEKMVDFLHQKDLETFSAEFICWMFDASKMSTFNQDDVLKAIGRWKAGHSSTDIMSVLQKICWNKVSPDITAIVVKEFFSTVENVEQETFWNKLSEDVKGISGSNVLEAGKADQAIKCIAKVDSVLLAKWREMQFTLVNNEVNLWLCLYLDYKGVWFKKDESLVEIPVKQVAFESSLNFNIEDFYGLNFQGDILEMVVSKSNSNNGGFKYSAVFSNSKPVYYFYIHSHNFNNISEIRLQNFVIY